MKLKTEQEIVEIANDLIKHYHFTHRFTKEHVKQFVVEYYRQAQSDLLESASDGFMEYVEQNKGLYFGDDHRKEMDSRVWQAASLRALKAFNDTGDMIRMDYLSECLGIHYEERIKELENKYQEAMKDTVRILNKFVPSEEVEAITIKYGLGKQEGDS